VLNLRIISTAALVAALLGCSSVPANPPTFLLTLESPVVTASRLDETGRSDLVRIDASGRIQQGVQVAPGRPWTLREGKVSEATVNEIIRLTKSIPREPFSGPERLPRFYSLSAMVNGENTTLIYNDGSLPCGAQSFASFLVFWNALEATLPDPQNGRPSCGRQ